MQSNLNLAGFATPWKFWNLLVRLFSYPLARIQFSLNAIPWRRGWHFYGLPVIQKHRQSTMIFGEELKLRSSLRSNPLAPNHAVFLTTWQTGARLVVGDDFAMTGGVLCAFKEIVIGKHVMLGANSTIVDTDFHPLDADLRRREPMQTEPASVYIEDDVFIGMNSLVLKGVRIGQGSVIGAGSVVTTDIPAGVIAAGNPARSIRKIG
jgi:acetyltransferase-like isoleucine patch superfamily enzyme